MTTERQRRKDKIDALLLLSLLSLFAAAISFFAAVIFGFVFLINHDWAAASLAGWSGLGWLAGVIVAKVATATARSLR